ncbi:MAG: cytochrome C [Desulfobulbaceae bacterium]|nr:cytochrome C [Desulfobulbaceae bacterium]
MAKDLHRNGLSYFGLLVAAIGLVLIVFTLLLSYSYHEPSPYIGIFAFLVFPGFIAFGLFMFLYGLWRENRRRRRAGEEKPLPYPVLNLNSPSVRKKFGVILIIGTIGAIFSAYLTYNTFAWTESVSFCGALCHTPMKPEYTAYQSSPHARVPCVKCHVGTGVNWFVKSKLSGLYQVYAVTTDSYPRPIPTPIANLRPSRETCEECHWPEKYIGTKLRQRPYFRYDEKNTSEQISLGVKIGGRLFQSIHFAHVVNPEEINFVELDSAGKQIPWVAVTRQDGSTEEYVSLDFQGAAEDLAAAPKRKMDCLGCHNRPSHTFWTPTMGVDILMTTNRISSSLPWIKKVAVDALVKEYPDRDTAHEGMQQTITGFYEKEYPKIYRDRKQELESAIEAILFIYDRNVFHDMKVNWSTYANNIGHKNWPGCFRCHDDRHVSKSGKVLTRDCLICHTIPIRGPLQPMGIVEVESGSRLPWHPMELLGKHATILCSDCHSAGFRPLGDCAECHGIDKNAPMMSRRCDYCHKESQEIKPVKSCADCHGKEQGGLHMVDEHSEASCMDCHKLHIWLDKGRSTCLQCHNDKREHEVEEGGCAQCHDFLG